MVDFGIRMEQARKKNKVTLEDLAAQTGYSVSTICRYERCVYYPSIVYVALFAKLMNVSIDTLVNG